MQLSTREAELVAEIRAHDVSKEQLSLALDNAEQNEAQTKLLRVALEKFSADNNATKGSA